MQFNSSFMTHARASIVALGLAMGTLGCGPDYYYGTILYPASVPQASIAPRLDLIVSGIDCRKSTISLCNVRGFDNEWIIIDLLWIWPPDSVLEMTLTSRMYYNTLAIHLMVDAEGFRVRRGTGTEVELQRFNYDGEPELPAVIEQSLLRHEEARMFAVDGCPPGTVGCILPVLARCGERIMCGEAVEVSFVRTARTASWDQFDTTPQQFVVQPVGR